MNKIIFIYDFYLCKFVVFIFYLVSFPTFVFSQNDSLILKDVQIHSADTMFSSMISEALTDSVSTEENKLDYIGKLKLRKPYKFFEKSPQLNKRRVAFIVGIDGGMYAAANAWWSNAWYSNYGQSKFHFFDDWKGWAQIDKMGHLYNAYFISDWSYNMFHWTGIKEKNAIWLGMLNAQAWMLSIEIHDGFQKKWGFSWTDIGANLTGSFIFGIQQYLWHDQRFRIKFSAFPKKYPQDLRERTDDLFGTSFFETVLKDYNATKFWLSVSPGSFIKKPESKFPKWLMFSFGYGANGMLGGSKNVWCRNGTSDEDIGDCPPQDLIDRTDIERYRQFYMSMDIDWTKLPVKRKWAKTCLGIINIIKLPFPAIEFNTSNSHKVRWHWLMF